MTLLTLLAGLIVAPSHALTWNQIQVGTPVELTQDLQVNKLLTGAGLECRIVSHAVYPKVLLGPTSPEAKARYFTVVGKMTDPITYRVYLRSEQLPCGCELNIDQAPEYLRGAGSEFKMLSIVRDLEDMAETPALATACSNLPDWMTPPQKQDEDGGDLIDL